MINRYFPFKELGLRGNPFQTLARDEWGEVAILPEALNRIIVSGFQHLQLTGPKGSGKTTALYLLADKFSLEHKRVIYERIPQNSVTYKTDVRDLDYLLLDEVQRLAHSEWQRLLSPRRNVSLIVSSHKDHRSLFQCWGYQLIGFNLMSITRTDWTAVLRRRLLYFSLDGKPLYRFSPEAIEYLWVQFAPDLRSVDSFLYEYFQEFPPPGLVEAESLSLFRGSFRRR